MNLRLPVATLVTTLVLARTAHADTPEAPPDATLAPAPVAPAPASSAPAAAPAPEPVTPAPALPPNGRAAPPTEAATRGTSKIRAGLEVFAEYNYRRTLGPGDSSTWFHQFDVPRVHGAIEGEYDDKLRGRLLLEAVRSASEGALVGVAGDSLVVRVREAYGAYKVLAPVEISAGVIPTLTIPELDGTWMLRAIAPSGIEANGLGAPADLGAKVRVEAPDHYGWAAVAATNGEGYAGRELNRGKSIEGAIEVHPLPDGALLPLGIFFSYNAGSIGTVSARADRLTSGLVWQGTMVRAGAFFTYAWGVGQNGTQHAALGTAFLRVEPTRSARSG